MFILLSNYANGWEAAFVGALQGGFIFLCILVYRHFRKKREAKKEKEEAEQKKVSSFIESGTESNTGISDSTKNGSDYLRSVFDEMKEKCNPQNYMNPYDHEKVRVANEIYSSLMSYETLNEEVLVSLRHRAIVELGIVFDTKAIYDYLCSICNPANYMDPYDMEKVSLANDIFAKIQQNKYNIEQLEMIRAEAKSLRNNSGFCAEKISSVLGNWKSSEPESFLRIILTNNEQTSERHYYLEKQVGLKWERDKELILMDTHAKGVILTLMELNDTNVNYQIKSASGDLVKYINHAVVERFRKR